MPTYKLTIEYEGTRYSGWQTQVNTSKTVQEHLTRAAIQVLGAQVEIGGAGRTDAGVHAAGQVAHLRAHKDVDARLLARKMNDLLPHDIHVVGAEHTDDRFHARHDAETRIYMYQIATRRTAFAKPFVWWIKDRLDVAAMQQAAAYFPGRHNFAAFTDRRLSEEESRIVVVDRFDVGVAGDLILVRVAASHFLWKMVRKLVACLVEVGRGTLDPGAIPDMLHEEAEPQHETAPPSGLFLEAIVYPGEAFERPLEPVVPVSTFAMRRTTSIRPAAARPEPARYAPAASRYADSRGSAASRDERPRARRYEAEPRRDAAPRTGRAAAPERDAASRRESVSRRDSRGAGAAPPRDAASFPAPPRAPRPASQPYDRAPRPAGSSRDDRRGGKPYPTGRGRK